MPPGHCPGRFKCLHGFHFLVYYQVGNKSQPAGKDDPGNDQHDESNYNNDRSYQSGNDGIPVIPFENSEHVLDL